MKVKQIFLIVLFSLSTSVLFAKGENEMEVLENYTFSYTGITKLSVEGVYFQVDIYGQSGEIVEADIEMPNWLRNIGVKVLHEINGSELRVWLNRPIPGVLRRNARMIFKVPAETDVSVKNNAGRIGIEKINGNMNVSTTSGRIDISESIGTVLAKTLSGAQSYSNLTGSVSAKSTSGRLSGSAVQITGESTFKTTSGAIDFEFSNEIEEFTFQLSSSSGRLSAGGSESKGNLEAGNGPIRIIGRSTSGRQKYR